MNREPAVIIGAIEAFAIAVVTLVAYHLGWEETQTALWLGVVTAAIAFVGSFFIRARVTPSGGDEQ